MKSYELSIESIIAGGDGLGFVELGGKRRAVLVPDAAPGDRLVVAVDPDERTLRGTILKVVTAGPDRVPAPCSHAVECGGCNWMHLAVEAQERIIPHLLQVAIPRAPAIAFHPATSREQSRTRARLHIESRTAQSDPSVGFYAKRSRDVVVPGRCVVLHPVLEKARSQLHLWLKGVVGTGEAQLALGHPEVEPRRAVLAIDWNGLPDPALYVGLERAVASGDLLGAAIRYEGTDKPAIMGDPTPWLMGADGLPLRLGVGGFAQATEASNAQLVKRVAHWAHELLGQGERRIVELYAGAGNLSMLLAKGAADYVLVESDGAACDAARENLKGRGLTARVIHADASTFEWKTSARLLVLDPPRTGAAAVVKRLAERPVRHVLYVSCDASTLARDLAILSEGGYELRALEAFEMFPYTSHFETLAVLTRKR